MPIQTRSRQGHYVAVALWLASVANAQAPTFAGESVATWAARLEADATPWVDRLAAGGADSLDVLRPLLDHDDYYVRLRSHLAVERMGASAAPLTPLLLARLRDDAASWSRHALAAGALGTIGADAPEVLDALASRCVAATAPALRAKCARVLAHLDDGAGHRLLGLAARDAFAARQHAIEALIATGNAAVETLIDALGRGGRAAEIARLALPEFGFLVCTRLERAGHPQLAQLALQRGAVRDVRFADRYEVVMGEPRPAFSRLPSGVFETGSGHGHGLQLWRLHEGPRGLVVDRLRLRTGPADDRGQERFVVTADRTVLPRALGLDLARQLATLEHMSLRRRPEAPTDTASSTGNFHARIRLQLDDEVLLDARFTGYPSARNEIGRAHV